MLLVRRHQQPPKASSPKDGSVRKRSRGGNKPPGRTLPLPGSQSRSPAGGSSPVSSSPMASPPQRPQAPSHAPVPALAADTAAGQPASLADAAPTPETALQQQQAPLSNGPVAPAAEVAGAVGSTLADLVLSEPLPRPEPAAVVLDPVVPITGGAAPIARPRSRAALEDTLASGVLANGIPALPADLSLDAPTATSGGAPSLQPLGPPGFCGFAAAPGTTSAPPPHAQGLPGAFGGSSFGFGGFGFRSVPASAAGLWQQQPPAPQPPPAYAPQAPQQQQPPQPQQLHPQQQASQQQPQHQQQRASPPPGLLGSQVPSGAALDAFYGGQGGGFGAFSQPPMQQQVHAMQRHQQPPPPQQQQLGRPGGLQAPQFGSFGGQGGSQGHEQQSAFGGFGQTAFVPTGKQPDWSVPSMGAAAGVPSSGLTSASQAFAAGGHPSSGSLGGMGSGPLGSGPMQQQPPDAGRPFMPPPGQQHGGGFGAPGQQHGGHAFFNQVRAFQDSELCISLRLGESGRGYRHPQSAVLY